MIYLFLGEDGEIKDAKIKQLKDQHFTVPHAGDFDYDIFYGNDLDSQTLQKSLLALPAVLSQRFILIRTCHKLNAQNQDLILDFSDKNLENAVLVLESSEWTADNPFVKKLAKSAKVEVFKRPQKKNVFDLTRLMTTRQPAEALQALDELTGAGTHPLQVLGGLVWFWGKQGEHLDRDRFEKGLRVLQQADVNIKRSRLDPNYAVEVAVVKLSTILMK
jgi:DNA polymerase III delta subunit